MKRLSLERSVLIPGCSVRSIPMLLAGLAAGSTLAAAQTSALAPAASALFAATPPTPLRPALFEQRDSVKRVVQPTQWKKGLILGGAVGAILGFVVANGFCDVGDCVGYGLTYALAGAGVFAIPGALIGGAFRKPGRDSLTTGCGSTRWPPRQQASMRRE